MERCPICKARLKSDMPLCPRCHSDLSKPLGIERQAKILCYQSIIQLKAGNFGDAKETLEQSLELKREPLVLALQGFISNSESLTN